MNYQIMSGRCHHGILNKHSLTANKWWSSRFSEFFALLLAYPSSVDLMWPKGALKIRDVEQHRNLLLQRQPTTERFVISPMNFIRNFKAKYIRKGKY
jgi:hypothetical protein